MKLSEHVGVVRTRDKRNAYKILLEKKEGTITLERRRHREEDNNKTKLINIGCFDAI
jgi:hypothetical protein